MYRYYTTSMRVYVNYKNKLTHTTFSKHMSSGTAMLRMCALRTKTIIVCVNLATLSILFNSAHIYPAIIITGKAFSRPPHSRA